MVGFNMQNTVMMPPNSFGCGMDISDRSSVRELACSGMPVPVHHRSGHPTARVRFRMPPPESLMSSGDSCVAKGTDFSRSRGGFLVASLPPSGAAVSYLSAVWCMGEVLAVPVRMVWLRCLRKSVVDACRPVIAISVVPKLVTTQAVWMPGL